MLQPHTHHVKTAIEANKSLLDLHLHVEFGESATTGLLVGRGVGDMVRVGEKVGDLVVGVTVGGNVNGRVKTFVITLRKSILRFSSK